MVQSYLIFHIVVELLSVVVALSLFLLAWNARRVMRNDYFLLLSTAFLAVGILDLFHLLTYKGMGVIAGLDANAPTQFWIASRYVLALSFFAAPAALGRKLRAGWLLAGYLLITLLLVFSILDWQVFPASYVEGQGLTEFKIASEYLILGFFALAGFFLYSLRRHFDRSVLTSLLAALALSILAELLFTLYISVYDVFNFLGHIAKVFAYYFVYRAIIEVGLTQPAKLLFFELKAASVRKDDYIRVLSHELKTPLTSIKLYAEILAQKFEASGEAEEREFALNIESQADKMNRLIGDLSDASKIETGRIQLHLSALDLGELLRSVVADFRLLHPGRVFELRLPEGLELAVRADRTRLQQVLSNFLSNAVKYSPDVSGKILVAAERENSQVKVSVQDFGIGIPAENLQQVFGKYYRTQTGARKAEGLGLGLYISRGLVKLHGGQVGVRSREGEGSTFFFTLPLAL